MLRQMYRNIRVIIKVAVKRSHFLILLQGHVSTHVQYRAFQALGDREHMDPFKTVCLATLP